MNLERVEELCLNYLGQSSNPLVPLNTLLEHCRRDPLCAQLQEKELSEFLKHHELVHVVEAPEVETQDAEFFAGMGIITGPRAILKGRFPSREEIAATLQEHLTRMTDALAAALEEAQREEFEPEAIRQLKEAMGKADALKDKVDKLL